MLWQRRDRSRIRRWRQSLRAAGPRVYERPARLRDLDERRRPSHRRRSGREALLGRSAAGGASRARETWAAVTLSRATRRRTGLYKSASGELVKLEVIVSPIRREGEIVGVFGLAIPVNDLPRTTGAQLSRRQLDVLRLLVQAKSTEEIAAEVHLAPETVRNHVGRAAQSAGRQIPSRCHADRAARGPGVARAGPELGAREGLPIR
jgi:Bacterial regulatory proteins, luxR family